jgi:hypothetical protein
LIVIILQLSPRQYVAVTEKRVAKMPKRLHVLVACALLVISLSSPAIVAALAQESNSATTSESAPPDSDLDSALAAKDWNRLTAAIGRRQKDFKSLTGLLNWLHAKVDSGAGLMVALAYMRDLWMVGNALKTNDRAKDLRMSSGLIGLYAFELIVIDGAKCEDRTAPDHRVDQLFMFNSATFAFLKSQPAEWKTKIVDIALALEKRTAPLRGDDDLICRDGLEQMKAGLERGTQHEVPSAAGQVGKTIAVEAPPDWVPKFVPPETYVPMQNADRAAMRETLLKLVN